MKAYQRKQLLERIDREGATVGARIPEELIIDGEPLDLRSFVFEIKRLDAIPQNEADRVAAMKRVLRRERTYRRQQIEDGAIEYETGEELARSIIGIDRALTALEQLEATDLEEEARTTALADQKRWRSFVRKVTDADGRDGRRRS